MTITSSTPTESTTRALGRRTRIGFLDTFGLRPLGQRLREAAMVFRGDPHTPPSKFGLSSVKIFKPSISLRTWLGLRRADRRVPLYNLFNHTQTPVEEGWSVLVTQVRDFRGGTMTYNSHNGTDFAIPVGTQVVAAAPGRVLLISNDFHRGGLKIFLDHGKGLITSYNHLGRSLVQTGDLVGRGQSIALSGASGVESLLCFPWVAPHVHFNVWLNGEYVDPFARAGSDESSLWRAGPHPEPYRPTDAEDHNTYEPTLWDPERLQHAISCCQVEMLRQHLLALPDPAMQAMLIHMQYSYFPGRFREKPELFGTQHPRVPYLDLPFRAEDFIGVSYPGFPQS